MKTTLSFCGGAGSVTGASFLIGGGETKVLVDCGLLQGERFAAAANREPFPFTPSSIGFLLVTHAHIDHIGRVPKLVREGFRGTIYSTPETRELAELMFADALGIMRLEEQEGGGAPLYDERDIREALALWKSVPYHTPLALGEFEAVLKDAGHILGSAMVEIQKGSTLPSTRRFGLSGRKIVFTGDLGNSPSPLLHDTEVITDATYLVMESVYGDRNHEERSERRERLAQVVSKSAQKGGVLLIPCFSIEKTQVLLSELTGLLTERRIPAVPVYLDSPLAEKVTEVYSAHLPDFKKELFSFPNLSVISGVEESHLIWKKPSPKIIIAGSGMSDGGRIVAHERHFLGEAKNTILFVGYQAAGSLGRRIQEGVKKVTIEREEIRVRATVETISGYSSHKDGEHLLQFATDAAEKKTLEQVFVVMGEPKASLFLAQRIRDYAGVGAVVPQAGEGVEISF